LKDEDSKLFQRIVQRADAQGDMAFMERASEQRHAGDGHLSHSSPCNLGNGLFF